MLVSVYIYVVIQNCLGIEHVDSSDVVAVSVTVTVGAILLLVGVTLCCYCRSTTGT